MRLRHVFAWLFLLPPLSAQPVGAPQRTSEEKIVVRAVTVKDSSNRPLKRLSAKDFAVVEDGVSRDIVFFKFQDLTRPIGLRKPNLPTSGSPHGTVLYDGRRLLVLYFELSEMSAEEQHRAQTAARQFVETRLAKQDLIQIMVRDWSDMNRPVLLAGFTDDRNTLLAAIRNIPRRPDPRPRDVEEDTFVPDPDQLALFTSTVKLEGLESVAAQLAPFIQRKSQVCFVTQRDFAVPEGLRARVEKQLVDTIYWANGSNVNIYSLGIG
jgi:VWFA-related protein